MQVPSKPDAAAHFDRILARVVPGRRGWRACQAFSSRSGMTRRVIRLVQEGLVHRSHADADGRGVVVQLKKSGLDRLTVTAPVHMRGVSDLFLRKLDDQELAVLESALAKVTLDCTFG